MLLPLEERPVQIVQEVGLKEDRGRLSRQFTCRARHIILRTNAVNCAVIQTHRLAVKLRQDVRPYLSNNETGNLGVVELSYVGVRIRMAGWKMRNI